MKFPIILLMIFSTQYLTAQRNIMERDAHSFANSADVVVKHIDLDLSVDFQNKILSGKATLTIDNKKRSTVVVFDTRDLDISRITLGTGETPAKFTLGDAVQYLGRPLAITITPSTTQLTIHYSTSPMASALQWLEPSQTSGKEKPFLFTQSQAILARTWVPCMDGPGVRFTYSATIRTRPDLLAVMSAEGNSGTKATDGVYRFQMKLPIPSYLLALAVGDLEFRPLGVRSGVYAEPMVIEKAANEFIDVEAMITSAEGLYGPYRWGRYDLLVLPPSFPFGGMENPMLTFATPTILAGDRSLVSLVAHELAHSWSGNLVTNATWNDFWLNEGFTVYFEQRIMEKVYGRTYSEMLAALALKDLTATIADLGSASPDTKLKLDLKGRDPDDGMTDIAYNKGYFFLRLCEETFGRERWDAFLKKYFSDNAFVPMTTGSFIAYFNNYFKEQSLIKTINVNAWVYGAGLPSNCPQPQSGEFSSVTAQIDSWKNGVHPSRLETKGWTTHHWLFFLHNLPATMPPEKMIELDYTFNFTRSGNAEILCEWFQRCIKARYETAYGPMRNYLLSIGRRKLIKPLYTELAKTPEGKEWAKEVYAKARPGYHSVSYQTIDDILK